MLSELWNKALSNIFRTLKGVAESSNEPSKYGIWKESFNRLQEEKKVCGYSGEYWRIWYDEVCPAYKEMTRQNRKIGIGYDSLTYQVLKDIEKEQGGMGI